MKFFTNAIIKGQNLLFLLLEAMALKDNLPCVSAEQKFDE
jgi:hypothetical protein